MDAGGCILHNVGGCHLWFVLYLESIFIRFLLVYNKKIFSLLKFFNKNLLMKKFYTNFFLIKIYMFGKIKTQNVKKQKLV